MISRSLLKFVSCLWLLGVIALTGCGGGGNTPDAPVPPPKDPTLAIWQTTLPDGLVGRAYSTSMTTAGSVGALTWSAENLPQGLTLDANGTLSGTPAYSGNHSVTIRVTDSGNPPETAYRTLSLRVFDQLRVNGNATATVTRSVPADITIAQASLGKEPYQFKVDGTIPGVSTAALGPYLVLQGSPTTAGTYPLRVTVEDSLVPSQSVSLDVSVVVDTRLRAIPGTISTGIVGRPYSATIPVANGTLPLTWMFQSKAPAGLSLNASTGTISGTPLEPWTDGVWLRVQDSSNPPQQIEIYPRLTIYDRLRVEDATLQDAHYNEVYQESLHAIGGAGLLSFTVVSGSLPPGLQLESAWLRGTPTDKGTYNFGLEIKDSATPAQVWRQLYSVTVLPPEVFIATQSLADAVLGSAYAAQLYGTRGTPPYRWSVDGGLPPGLTMTQAGKISGTPQSAGAFRPKFTITDSASPAQSKTVELAIEVGSQRLRRNDTIATATPADYRFQWEEANISPYADPIDAPNPDTDYYRFMANAGSVVKISVMASGTLDPVLELVDSSGGIYHACIDPGDDNPPTDLIAKDPTPLEYDDTCMNDDVELGKYRSSRLEFKVPGTPGTQTTFYAHVFDFRGDARPDMTYRLYPEGTVSMLRFETNLSAPKLNWGYYGFVAASGGTGQKTLTVTSGALPPGLTYGADGTIFGTPTAPGAYEFTVEAKDSGNPPQIATLHVSLPVMETLKITTTSLPEGTTGAAYTVTFSSEGGLPQRSWYIYGSMPRGLAINRETATISGVPEEPGTFDLSVAVADMHDHYSRAYTIVVTPGPLSVETTAVADAYLGWDYITELKAKGGTPSPNTPRFQWALAAGSLPPGMELRNDGTLTGRPTAVGTHSFTVQVTDAATPAQVATGVVTMTVRPSP